ncbi:MAG TPA: PQQ-binding-like beta-propeller repeat protein [Pirellulales bacterium]|nr:PQQ-binding-like beta-propeller repeat protein [Pirellulales bacterium]
MGTRHFQWCLFFGTYLSVAAAIGEENKPSPQWSQFRGPEGQGAAADGTALPLEFGPTKNVLWKVPLQLGHSSPCIWNDRIFLAAADSGERRLMTICLDRQTGEVRWERSFTVETLEPLHQLNCPASSTPATDGRLVYVYFGSYGLLAYDLDGNEQWKKPLTPMPGWFGSGASPVVADGLVLLNSGTQSHFSLLAVDAASGELKWQKDRPRGFSTGIWSTPAIVHAEHEVQVFVAGGTSCAAYSLNDGAERWSVSGLPSISLNTASIGEGMIFFSLTNPIGEPDNVVKLPTFDEALKQYDRDSDGKIAASELPADVMLFSRGRPDKIGDWAPLRELVGRIDGDKDGAVNKDEWQAGIKQLAELAEKSELAAIAVRLGGEGNVSDTHVAWKQTTAVPEVPSLLYHDGRVYLVSEKGILTCRAATTGKELYKQRLGTEGTCYASPVVGDDKIYVASDGGTVIVFEPGDRYRRLAKNDFDEAILATPALVEGKIYLRTQGHLYAFGLPDLKP